MNPLDIFVENFFTSIRSNGMTEFMYLVSTFFDVSIYSILATILIGILIYMVRGKRYGYLFGCTMFFGAVIAYILKLSFHVQRPTQAVFSAFGPSFPSYHAVIVTIFFLMLIFIFDDFLKGYWRKAFNFVCIFSIFLISTSRLYLGVHWLSDVLAGIFIGSIISYGSIVYFRRLKV